MHDKSHGQFTRRCSQLHRNSLSREAVDVPLLEVFKARLDGALGNLVQWKLSLPTAGVEFVWSFRSLSTQSIL